MNSGLLWIGLICAAGWFWYDSMRVRERATIMARGICSRSDLQFLEGTVSLSRFRLVRASAGHMVFARDYLFEYTVDGESRQQGFLLFKGQQIESSGLAKDPYGD